MERQMYLTTARGRNMRRHAVLRLMGPRDLDPVITARMGLIGYSCRGTSYNFGMIIQDAPECISEHLAAAADPRSDLRVVSITFARLMMATCVRGASYATRLLNSVMVEASEAFLPGSN